MTNVNDSTILERLGRLDTCAVSDSLDKLSLKGTVTGLSPLSRLAKVYGRVITVKLVKADVVSSRGAPAPHLGARAIEMSRKGDVIVVEQRTGIVAGSWGGILSTGAKVRGIAGVISDGLVRDVDEARGLGFPIYARGSTALTARGRVAELETGGTVQIADATVQTGDYVIADGTAVVFVSASHIAAVLDTAEQISARESIMSKALMEGMSITHVMGADYEEMLKR
ncbi:4-hydroxy-4-methyl-2-oxoglutarate aldolase [Paraburkholderia sp. GAS448]|jgi:regulator of RNase E activity RraA|uniref:RraA family protein n=1 Tax=Paraburkholderia sp. GAS448 TaxID=3035136 RepID=UPI003D1FF175